MRSPWTILFGALCAVAALVWLMTQAGGGSAEQRGRDAAGDASTPKGGTSVRALDDEPETQPLATGALPEGEAPLRVALDVPLPDAGGDPLAPGPGGFVMGVVADANGAPIPGVKVALMGQEVPSAESDVLPSGFPPPRTILPAGEPQRTDSRGAFLFEGCLRSWGGQLEYGEGLVLSGPLVVGVDESVDWQVLRLPRFEEQRGHWTVEVVDTLGDTLHLDKVDLQLASPASAAVARYPWPHERTTVAGLVDQRGLAPGTWQLVIIPVSGLPRTVEWAYDGSVHEHTTRLEFDLDSLGIASEEGPVLEDDGSSWVDPGSGLLDWLPETRVSVGEDALNRHFAQTMRFGSGPVRGATLTIRLRAMLHNASNDAIYLDHTGSRSFAWRSSIAPLVGGSWGKGDVRTLRLDLSRLPNGSGDPTDLRPWLEDGLLDIVVQDDTTIDDVRIRVLR